MEKVRFCEMTRKDFVINSVSLGLVLTMISDENGKNENVVIARDETSPD